MCVCMYNVYDHYIHIPIYRYVFIHLFIYCILLLLTHHYVSYSNSPTKMMRSGLNCHKS